MGAGLQVEVVLSKVEDSEGCNPFSLVFEERLKFKVEKVADGRKVKHVLADLLLKHFATVLAHLAFNVRGHVLLHIPVRDVGRELLTTGLDFDAPTGSYSLNDGAIDARACLLKLRDDIENAPMANEILGDCVLKRGASSFAFSVALRRSVRNPACGIM